MDNFLSLMQKYENKLSGKESEQLNDVLSKLNTQAQFMGSVEEEMAKLEKLESNSCLDTSIECEALFDLQNVKSIKKVKIEEEIMDKKTNDNANKKDISNMDVEMQSEELTEQVQNKIVSESTNNELTKSIQSLTEFMHDESTDKIKLDLSKLNMNEMFKLSQHIENIELKLIEFKRHLRNEMKNKI